jgi:hypothetical protein
MVLLPLRDPAAGWQYVQQSPAPLSAHRPPAGLLQPLRIPEQRWASVSMDSSSSSSSSSSSFIVQLPRAPAGHNASAVMVVVDRLSRMTPFVATDINVNVTAVSAARLFFDNVVYLYLYCCIRTAASCGLQCHVPVMRAWKGGGYRRVRATARS